MSTNTVGTVPLGGAPGSDALTSFQLSSAGSLAKLTGSAPACDHGPLTSLAFSHMRSFRR